MAKTWRKTLIAALLTLCTVLCIGAFAACNQGTPQTETKTYTVEVRTDEGAASGVKVTVKKGGASFETKTTDASGTVTFELAADDYVVELKDIPAHYEIPANASTALTTEMPQLTITLARKFAYKVYLVNEDDTPFYSAGVTVGICTLTNNCLEPVAIDEDGLAILEHEKSDYHVQILDLPAGYAYLSDENGYYTGKNFSATETEMSIKIYTVPELMSTTPMTSEAKTAFATENELFGFDEGATAYSYSKEVPAHTTVYFSITPTLTGEYSFYTNYNTMNYFDGATFKAGASDNYLPQYSLLEAGKTYYFALCNAGDASASTEFVVTAPYSSYTVYRGVGGTFDVTVGKENTVAIIEYTTTATGTYTLTTQGTTLTLVGSSTYKPYAKLEPAPDASDYAAGSSIDGKITASAVAHNQTTVYFTVTAKADSYPATVSVKIEKTAEGTDKYTYAEVKETLTQYADKTEGTELYGIPMDGTATLVYNTTDKFYHLGTEDGKVVVVSITTPLGSDRFFDEPALAYMELVSPFLATYEFAPDSEKPNDVVNYTKFLRGFETYAPSKLGGIAIPEEDDIETEVYYAKYVNEDGVYPLTKELKTFLELFYAANEESFYSEDSFWSQVPSDSDPNCRWMFPLYYYDAVSEADAIVGEYKFVKYTSEDEEIEAGGTKQDWDENWNIIEVPVTDLDYKLVVNKNNTFTIYELWNGEYAEKDSGTWSKNDGVYTFAIPFGAQDPDTYEMIDLVYTVTITATTITLNGADGSEWIFAIPTNA